jgi:ribosome biogenesis protein ERB1
MQPSTRILRFQSCFKQKNLFVQVVKIVRAIRKGWVSFDKKPEKPRVYLLWEDDFKTADKTANGLTYIPAPKPKLPGEKHESTFRTGDA